MLSVTLVTQKKFSHAVNATFGKVLRVVTEDTVPHLISTKCMPILLYELDTCPLNVADKRSLDFVLTRLLMKLFKISFTDVIHECCVMFDVKSVSDLILNQKHNFLMKFVNCDNIVCGAVCIMARRELDSLT